jgi:hypothetical protein
VTIEVLLRAELTAAMRRRDNAVVAVLRSALSAMANAEASPAALPPPATASTDSIHIAGATAGLGATEVARFSLTEQDRESLLTTEAAELSTRVDHLTRLCRYDEADGARRGLHILRQVLDATPRHERSRGVPPTS